MNKGFHTLLHHSAGRWREFMVINFDDTRGHFIQALTDDVQALAHFLHTAQIAVVTVTIFANGNIELNLDVPRNLRNMKIDL